MLRKGFLGLILSVIMGSNYSCESNTHAASEESLENNQLPQILFLDTTWQGTYVKLQEIDPRKKVNEFGVHQCRNYSATYSHNDTLIMYGFTFRDIVSYLLKQHKKYVWVDAVDYRNWELKLAPDTAFYYRHALLALLHTTNKYLDSQKREEEGYVLQVEQPDKLPKSATHASLQNARGTTDETMSIQRISFIV